MLVKGRREKRKKKRRGERGAKGNSADQATGHKMYEIVNNRFGIYGKGDLKTNSLKIDNDDEVISPIRAFRTRNNSEIWSVVG